LTDPLLCDNAAVEARDVLEAAGEGVPAELVAVELRTECPKCGSPLPVDGLERELVCGSCSSELELPRSVFAAALDGCYTDIYVRGRGVMREDHAEREGRDVHWTRGPGGPQCESCGAITTASPDGKHFTCTEHGDQGAVEPAPAWLKSIDFTIEGYVPPRGAAAGGDEPRKVATRCANCGSALQTDGAKRTVDCGYCNTVNVLPEEVWHALHPPRAPRRFWVVSRLFYDPRRETPSAWAEIKEGLGTIGCGLVFLAPVVLAAVAGVFTAGSWLVETFGQGGVIGIWIGSGVVALGLLIYVARYFRRYWRWRKIFKADQELVGRLGPFEELSGQYGTADIGLTSPGRPEQTVSTVNRHMLTRDEYERLGGEGGTLRAWMVPGRDDLVEVRLVPSALA
jgi:hypothetical protein